MYFPNAEVFVNPAMLLLLGLILGTLSGFFGVGGGFLITGGLLVFGVPAPFAVGTGLTLIMGSSIINTLKHRRLGNVDFKLGLFMVSGTIPALVLAQWMIQELKVAGLAESTIRYAYVVVLAVLGSFILYDSWRSRRQDPGNRETTSTAAFSRKVQGLRLTPAFVRVPFIGRVPLYIDLPVSQIKSISVLVPFGVGFLAGLFAGLLGAGGGTILMPILIYVVGVPTAVAIGTDLFQVILTGTMGTFLKAYSNEVDPLMESAFVRVPFIGRVPLYIDLPVSQIKSISVLVPFGVGFLAGLFAGLLGAGGGTILMPILIYVVGVPTAVAIGTDLFQVILTGTMGTFLKAYSNEVDPLMVVIMLVAASMGSQLGATATGFVEASRIRFMFGITVLSGCVAVGLEQISNIGVGPAYLSSLATILLLGVGGAICLVIAGLLISAKIKKPEASKAEV